MSTLYINNSEDAITRLVRTLCPHCKEKSKEIIAAEFQEIHRITEHFIPKGCPNCYYTGYKGRRAFFEVLPISVGLQTMIKSGESDIHEYLHENKIPAISDNLQELVGGGITSIAESLVHATT